MAGSHFVAFDPMVIPARQIVSWFKAPASDDDEFVSSSDESSFRLDDLNSMKITTASSIVPIN
jgi:hypothetical protein